MKRFAHLLKPNQNSELPRLCAFYDTETWQKEISPGLIRHDLRLGVACFVRLSRDLNSMEEWTTFSSSAEFWGWADDHIRAKTKCYLFAHNQHFDFFTVKGFQSLKERGYELKSWWIDSNRFIAKFWNKTEKKSIWVLDTLNYFKASVEQLGEVLNLPKFRVDFDRCDEKELETYCKRDVEIIKEMMLWLFRFLKDHDLGNFAKTDAGQAFTAFRHRFMRYPIYIHNHEKAIELERESYRGGRCECFRIGKFSGEKYYMLDVNSLYPSIMASFSFPCKLVRYEENPKWEFYSGFLDKYDVICEALIETDEPVIGVKREKLIFPVGQFWAFLCTPELDYVLKHGKVLEVKRAAAYEKAPLFKDYVKFFYGLKVKAESEGNKVYRDLAKRLLNSLYGKFGQTETQRELECEGLFDDGVQDYINGETGERGMYVTVCGQTWDVSSTERPSFNSFPAISSLISAYGRMVIWHLIKMAGVENVYYCDTDGLIVNEKGYKKLSVLVEPHGLGYLSVKKISDELEIWNAKHYRIGDDLKIKGIRKDAERIGENEFKQMQFLKTRGAWRKGLTDTAYSLQVVKKLRMIYDKGYVDGSGKVHPFRLWEPGSAGGDSSSIRGLGQQPL